MTGINDFIDNEVKNNDVVLFMKGTPQFPQCGFSARAVEVMTSVGQPFAYVNILEAPEIRTNLPQYGNWPTFPQLWVKGELVGGSDILLEMHRNGQLAELIEAAASAPSKD